MLDVMELAGFTYYPRSLEYGGYAELHHGDQDYVLVDDIEDAFQVFQHYYNSGRQPKKQK